MGMMTACTLLVLASGLLPYAANDRTEGLLGRITEARAKLAGESVRLVKGVTGTRRIRVGRRRYRTVPVTGIVAREMAIAVCDSQGKIGVARAVKRDKGLEVSTPGYILSVRRENGINSDIACIEPPAGVVLAVKYPVSNEGGRFGPGPDVIEAVYTPYSPEIGTQELVSRGLRHQAELIERAFARLYERAVPSFAFPGEKVAKIVPKELVTILLINEHIDPRFFNNAKSAAPLAEQVLSIIGANTHDAYAYSISPAGARGLVQMIPSTYRLISQKYPEAELIRDFASGMRDPINAVMAQVLLCDSDWQMIRTRADIPADRVGPYLAAAYNGGVRRVLSLISDDEADWVENPDLDNRPTRVVAQRVRVRQRGRDSRSRSRYVVKTYRQPIFRAETNKYVAQYHWIKDFLEQPVVR
jgi:hypothetical protein